MGDPRQPLQENRREHRLPLSDAATAILRARKGEGGSEYVFTRGRTPIANFARTKAALDELTGPFEKPWTFHDLRRTGASTMPALGVSLPTTEKLLNHVSGSFAGIVGIYQRHDFWKEMVIAVEAWAQHLTKIQADNVIEFRRPA